MTYIDAYVLAVPTADKEAYIEHATMAADVFREYGALSVHECWGDDVPEGEITSLPLAVKCQEDEKTHTNHIFRNSHNFILLLRDD